MKKSDGSTWKIDHQCPQCGAPVTLDETDHLLACNYCRVRLWLHSRGVFNYCFMPEKPPREELAFIPYWRFRGLGFSCTGDQVRHRFVDTTLCGLKTALVPRSLGFRPQVLRLKPSSAIQTGTFVKPTVVPSALKNRFIPAAAESPGTLNGKQGFHQAFIGDTLSLVHSPVYERDGLIWDAMLHRPLGSSAPLQSGELSLDKGKPPPLTFIPALCPHCGWELEGSSQSVVLLCRNCHSAWKLAQGAIQKVPFGFPVQPDPEHPLLPFWQMRFRFTGIRLESREDLGRLANTRISDGNENLAFWIPAFKVPPRLFLRVAQKFCLSATPELQDRTLPPVTPHPATLPLDEAVESVKILLASVALPRRRFMEQMGTVSAALHHAQISFVPFTPNTHDLVHPGLQLSIPRRALALGRFL